MSLDVLAFYGDNVGDQLVVFSTEKMKVVAKIPTGKGPYPVDRVADKLLYVITRGEKSVTPIDLDHLKALPKITLAHHPRSSARNPDPKSPYVLVAGADVVQTSLIDTSKGSVEAIFGPANTSAVRDFGGGLASGHPAWLPDGKRFFLLDRVSRRIEVYKIDSDVPIWSVNTPTSVHHLSQFSETRWYGLCEGNRESRVPPSVLQLDEKGGKFEISGMTFLPVPAASIPQMGSHHLTIHPNRKFLYVGSAEGRLYTLETATLEAIELTDTGPGCGHVTPSSDSTALTTNHNGVAMTVINLATHRRIDDLVIASAPPAGKKSQAHTSKRIGDKFYTAASHDGKFLEIDMNTLSVSRTCEVPGAYLLQGTFV